jgi:hypothetical protein
VLLETANISVEISDPEKSFRYSRVITSRSYNVTSLYPVCLFVSGQIQQELERLSRIARSLKALQPLHVTANGAETGTPGLPRSARASSLLWGMRRSSVGPKLIQLATFTSGPNSTNKPSGPTIWTKLSGPKDFRVEGFRGQLWA